ncbi:endonuclease VII domain-containing protein [bacterium]|jgi:hypothetical protein|nr:endonuclease VII domain-containing protein [bacterium]
MDKTCRVCSITEKELGKPFPASYGAQCSTCKNGKYRYGLNRLQQLELLKKQNNSCAICEKDIKLFQGNGKQTAQIDHKPGTQGNNAIVRGILCFDCNNRLSNSTARWLKRAIQYLER